MSFDFSGRFNFNEEYAEKKSGKGGNREKVLDISQDVPRYTPQPDGNRIDIVPFPITNENNPLVVAKKAKVGDYDYLLDVFEHQWIGPEHKNVVCLYKTYGKPCPICEAAQVAYNGGDEQTYRALKAKHRCYYNVIDRNSDDDSVKLFDVSFEWFESELREEASACEPRADYANPETGKRVKFRAVPSDLKPDKNGKVPLKYKSFSFIDREPITYRLKDAIPLDKFMKVYSYDALKAMLEGGDTQEDAPQETERPVPREPVATGGNVCPSGHQFGKDCDQFKDCHTCQKWSECDRASM